MNEFSLSNLTKLIEKTKKELSKSDEIRQRLKVFDPRQGTVAFVQLKGLILHPPKNILDLPLWLKSFPRVCHCNDCKAWCWCTRELNGVFVCTECFVERRMTEKRN